MWKSRKNSDFRSMDYPAAFFALAITCLPLSFSGCKVGAVKNADYISAYKNCLDTAVSSEGIDDYLKVFCAEPHAASSARNNFLAKLIHDEWKALGLDDVRLMPYDVLLSFPEEIHVELLSPQKIVLKLKEDSYPEDPDTYREDVGIPYNAYSRSGDITAALVYANSGNPQDYDLLEARGIDLQGKIALVRYSTPYSYRGYKAYTAEKRGVAGLLIYSDPKEDGIARGEAFPHGPWGPLSHIQRGGIPYDFIYPGDPLTPEWPSTPGCRRISQDQAESLPHIVCVPLSARDALPLLEAMGGEQAPEDWTGALPVSYRLGGSQAYVRMQVKMTDSVKRITDVVGCLRGSEEPELLVLAGNHRDAWVFGGHDPSSGTACLMELVRVFAEAKKKGFQPRRTICFASWDAEEFTLTGSTEYGEHHRDKLRSDLVAYLNVDSSASGQNFSVQAVPALNSLLVSALKEVNDPLSKESLYEGLRMPSSSTEAGMSTSTDGFIEPIGSGTDHAVFLNHVGAPALDMSFSGDYGVYHSMYDNYYWMSHFGDPGMLYTAALTKLWAHMIIDLSCLDFLPLDYAACAAALRGYLRQWAEKYDPDGIKSQKLNSVLEDMENDASEIKTLLAGPTPLNAAKNQEEIRGINRKLMQVERDFLLPEGIPKRPWFKHLVFGARYTYAVLLFPELTEAAEESDESGVNRALLHLEEAAKKAIAHLREAKGILSKTIKSSD